MKAGVCELCPQGYWCDGAGQNPCEAHSTTQGGGKADKQEQMRLAQQARDDASRARLGAVLDELRRLLALAATLCEVAPRALSQCFVTSAPALSAA